ncbi:YlxR family protein [bacterium]|nr:YlxR family protein [bacterium]
MKRVREEQQYCAGDCSGADAGGGESDPVVDSAVVGGTSDHSLCAPQRCCLGCRERASQEELVRIFFSAAGIERAGACFAVKFPLKGRRRRGLRLHGRSAYIHERQECLARAVHPKQLSRAFRAAISGELASALEKGICGVLETVSRGAAAPEEFVHIR